MIKNQSIQGQIQGQRLSSSIAHVIICLASVSLLIACGSTPTKSHKYYYETTLIKTPKVKSNERKNLINSLPKMLGRRTVHLKTKDGKRTKVYPKKSKLNTLSHSVLRALWMASPKQYFGAEFDFKIVLSSKKYKPVSVLIDLKGNIIVEEGVWPKYETPKSPKEVQNRWKVGALKGKGVKWSARALRSINLALSLLETEERAILSDVPFIRKKRSKDKRKGALYVQEGDCDAYIIIYDLAVISQSYQFTGSLKRVLPATTMTILHEVGHGIHRRNMRTSQCKYAKLLKERNQHAQKGNASKGNKRAQHHSEVKRLDKTLKKLNKKINRFKSKGPVLASYQKVLGKAKGPTTYGETSLAESFAESFALYHTDPAALKRVLPKVYTWFKKGAHMKAMGSL